MGGRGDKAPPTAHDTVPICRDCHTGPDGIHAKRWAFEVGPETAPRSEQWVEGANADGTTFSHPLVMDDESPSPAKWSDAKLGLHWEEAGAKLLKQRATIANIYQMRWGWGQGWARRAADAMGGGAHGTGQQISERTVRRCAAVWKHWKGDWELMKQLGSVTVAYAIAGAEDTDAALVIAEKGIEADKKAGEIVREIEGKSDNVAERCTCPDCGTEHRKGD
jgi:hypothetical protein